MSVADISGPGGNITLPTGVNIHVSAWSATPTITAVETTGFAEVGNRTFDPTAITITGGCVGTGQSGNTGVLPAAGVGATPTMSSYKGNVTLTAASGCTLAFAAVITAFPLDRPHDGKLTVACSFQSSGAITQTWA